jgi:hypothetical protein
MALAVTTTTLPNAFINVPYSATLSATGGTPPYTWAITAGALPAGLTLSPAGVISGTPPKTGSVSGFTVQVTDTVPATATQALNLAVNTVITLQCATCGFYQKTTNINIANLIVPQHLAGYGPAHVVSMS